MMAKSLLALTCIVAAAVPGGREGSALLLATPPSRAAAEGVAHRPALSARRGAAIPKTYVRMTTLYAAALWNDPGATLDDLREAVTTLEDTERIARRVLGGAHPLTLAVERNLRNARFALRARETPPPGSA